ncbi:hypothetical protein Z517_08704 [Fonsecaea pedrosoi CBS 271.37]|uniref:Major facilitator superfamily (MFS) profile domain-containing protein n=1 Tax=Fonsecaea pedrosoi CBS 271.37 TaxID=1442368 RepID=A0A0D2GJY6_9EURO|nr:uncharacterized protein Z517_08704 [Fonsecaea pedrosoi CBS 271.37]KIW78865.1 hypothetical protein Z517_08704 [Fonsecaea pedrosoi CBS 271.37]
MTADNVRNHGGNAYNFIIIFTVALGSFAFGFNAASFGSVMGLPGFFSYYDISLIDGGSASNRILGASNGTYYGGGLIGCLFAAWLADKYGRIRNLQITCAICVVGAIIQSASVHMAMFLVGRTIGGAGSGMIVVSVPIYQSEVSPAAQRGRMVGQHGFLLVAGYAVAGWSGFGCYFQANPQIQWRLLLALQVVAPLALIVASPWVPESPRWLVHKAKDDRAMDILKKLHHTSEDVNDLMAREEYYQIHAQIEYERTKPNNLWAMWKVPSYRRRLVISWCLQFLAQSTGCVVVANYQVLLYNNLGLHDSIPLLLAAVYLSWAAGCNLFAAMVVDRWGRILMITVGVFGCLVMLSCTTAMIACFAGTDNKVGNGFGVFFIFALVGFYGSCIDANSFIYCTEIFPTHARAQGLSFAFTGYLVAAIIYNEVAPTAFANVGYKFFFLFIALMIVGLPLFWYYSPETKGLTLEEIATLFGDEVLIDLSNMTAEERERLDQELMKSEGPDFVKEKTLVISEEREYKGA